MGEKRRSRYLNLGRLLLYSFNAAFGAIAPVFFHRREQKNGKTNTYYMPAFIIVDVEVTDPNEYEEYKKLTPAAITAYGGKFIVRGGPTETLEGDWQPGRMVVLEFPSTERAKEWWSSDVYSKAKAIRQRSAKTNMIVVEGV